MIGWMVYGEDMFPITRVEMEAGAIRLISQVRTEWGTEIQIDRNASCTIIGLDLEQVAFIKREGEPDWYVAADGGLMEISQLIHVSEVEHERRA
jgi:hypothetical protein